MFQLVDSGWEQVFQKAAAADADELLIICPYIKAGPMKRLLDHSGCSSIRVLTRLSERDLFDGVSDVSALELLLDRKATVRGIKNLHAKLFVFGASSVVAGSANLTEAAWRRNLEFGFTSGQPEVIEGCRDYFDSLWKRTSVDLTRDTLNAIRANVEKARKSASPTPKQDFHDHGQDLGSFSDPTPFESLPARSFVKFFGEGHNRASLDSPIAQIVDSDGSHYACSFPAGKRPRRFKDGDTVFIGHFVPGDLIVYGRALAHAHVEGRDDASESEKARRTWKAKWPHYVRVHSAEFVGGELNNGVSLNALKADLGAYCFRSTAERARAGDSDVKPESAYRQQAQVELTAEGWAWMTERLQTAFAKYGKLSDDVLAKLDWPTGSLVGHPSEDSI